MAIGKPRGKTGMRPVFVYDAAIGRKVYVGSRRNLRGPGGAEQLERDKKTEFADRTGIHAGAMTCRRYADERWLARKHGPNTRRPSPTTLQVNRDSLKPFLRDFGDRDMRSIARIEALDWATQYPRHVKAVSAMFSDAVDDQILQGNPFANRRSEQPRGRKDIHPLTETEVEQLAQIARDMWGQYGRVVAAWILFLAWVGCRPGEAFRTDWSDLDFEQGEATIHRVKKPYRNDVVVFPRAAQRAVMDMRNERSGLLFTTATGKPMAKGNAGYFFRPVQAALLVQLPAKRRRELTDGKGSLQPYALRHFCASLMADRGLTEFDIAAQLGNSPQVCRETYIHTHRDRARDRARLALEGSAKVVNLDDRRAG